MTKQEALQKIEELKKFVEGCDKEHTLKHGDQVYAGNSKESKRIVITTRGIREYHLKKDYILFDEYGSIQNNFNHPSEVDTTYTKTGNVFKG